MMTYCNGCADDQCEFRSLFGWICSRFIPKTNADKIRAMGDEELSGFLCKVRNGDAPMWCDYRKCETRSSCSACRLNWLKHEAE